MAKKKSGGGTATSSSGVSTSYKGGSTFGSSGNVGHVVVGGSSSSSSGSSSSASSSRSGGGGGGGGGSAPVEATVITGTRDTEGKAIPEAERVSGVYVEGKRVGQTKGGSSPAGTTAQRQPTFQEGYASQIAPQSYAQPTIKPIQQEGKTVGYQDIQAQQSVQGRITQAQIQAIEQQRASSSLKVQPTIEEVKEKQSQYEQQVEEFAKLEAGYKSKFEEPVYKAVEAQSKKTGDIWKSVLADVGIKNPVSDFGINVMQELATQGITSVVLAPAQVYFAGGKAILTEEALRRPETRQRVLPVLADTAKETGIQLLESIKPTSAKGIASDILIFGLPALGVSSTIKAKYTKAFKETPRVNLLIESELKGQRKLSSKVQEVGVVTEGISKLTDAPASEAISVGKWLREDYKPAPLKETMKAQTVKSKGIVLAETERYAPRKVVFKGETIGIEEIRNRILENKEFTSKYKEKSTAFIEAGKLAKSIYEKSAKETVYSSGGKTVITTTLPTDYYLGIKTQALAKPTLKYVQTVTKEGVKTEVFRGGKQVAVDFQNIQPKGIQYKEEQRLAQAKIKEQSAFGDMKELHSDYYPTTAERRYRLFRKQDVTGTYRADYGAKTYIKGKVVSPASETLQSYQVYDVEIASKTGDISVKQKSRVPISTEKTPIKSSIEFFEGGEPKNKPFSIIKEEYPIFEGTKEVYRTEVTPQIKVQQYNKPFATIERKGTVTTYYSADIEVFPNVYEIRRQSKIIKDAEGNIIKISKKPNKPSELKDMIASAPTKQETVTTQNKVYQAKVKVSDIKTSIKSRAEKVISSLERTERISTKSQKVFIPVRTEYISQGRTEIKPIISPVVQPVTKPVVQPVTKPVVQPVTKPVVQPVTKPVVQPVTKPVVQPVTKPVVQPVTKPVVQPVTKPVVQPVTKPVVQPVTKPVVQPVTKPVITPTTKPIIPEVPLKKIEEEEKPKKKRQMFSVQVRRRGVFRSEGVFETPEQAIRAGELKTASSASASFKIKALGGAQINAVAPSQRYYASKKESGVIIQKPQFRISSAGEKREITYRGIFASRQKRQRKNIFG